MSADFALPAVLTPSLTDDRAAIADAIYRSVLGLDMADENLFDSAFTHDAVFELNGKKMEGLPSIKSECYANIAPLDTTHLITNVRVNVNPGGRTAQATCTSLAQHYGAQKGLVPGAARLLAGGFYGLDLVKADDSLWKIKFWKLKSTWAEGDWTVLTGN